MGAPRSSSTTAGAGTGMSPWALRTMPTPLATGLASTSSTPSTSSAAQVPTTSMMASMPPTSWKWTLSGGRRCRWPSATASASNVARARRRTRSGRRASVTRPLMWAAVRTTELASARTCTLVPPMPARMTGSASSDHPPMGRRSHRLRTSARSAPASTSAPRAMSPAIPEKQWNQATVPASACAGSGTVARRHVGCGRSSAIRGSVPMRDRSARAEPRATGNRRARAQAAPNPLSMPTTVMPEAHEASIDSNAVTPSSPAP